MKKLLIGQKIYNAQTQTFERKNILIVENKYRHTDHAKLEDSCDMINLKNQYLYPSIVDSHAHLLGIGIEQSRFSLKGVNSEEALRTGILTQNTSFIILRGWDEEFLGFFPDRRFIDSVKPDVKCLLIRKCGHTGTCNTPLMEVLKQNGIQEIDDSDFSRGILKERVLEQAMQMIKHSKEDLAFFLKKGSEKIKKHGITCMHTDDYHSSNIKDLRDVLVSQKDLRIFEKINPESPQELLRLIKTGIFKKDINDYISIQAVKVFLDGSFGARSAYLKQPYEGTDLKGVVYMKPEEFSAYVRICEENELQLLVHVIGDGALDVALEGFQRSISSYNPLRHRIIHLQMASEEQLKRIKEMNLFLSIQPVFYTSDFDMAIKMIGKKRMEEIAYPFRKALDMGIELSLSTDAPVEDHNPFKNMISATHFFDLKTAFEKYTVASAKAGFWEEKIGRVEEGYYADGFLSDKNIFELDSDQLANFKPKTILYDGHFINNISD